MARSATELARAIKPKQDNPWMYAALAVLVGLGFSATRVLPIQETASRDAIGAGLLQRGCIPLNDQVIQSLSEGLRITTATGETLAPGTVVCTRLGDIAVIQEDGRVGEVAGGETVRKAYPEILNNFLYPKQ